MILSDDPTLRQSDARDPSPPSVNGRDPTGRFAPGNRCAPGGYPAGRKVAELRAALLESVSDDDMREIAARLVTMAKGGDIRAIAEVFQRTLGKPVESDLLARLDEIESRLAARAERGEP